MATHQDLIREQFTKQAVPFATDEGIKDEEALTLTVEFTGAGPQDTVLDVACGPGLVVCAFAPGVQHATGLDLTPAMIDQARALQQAKGLANVTLQVGDVLPLPYPDASFSIVTCRYAFHHFPAPHAVLAEMKRVCRPEGKVVVIDVATSPDPDKGAAYDQMEKLRDPSHVHGLTLAELEVVFDQTGLPAPRQTFYGVKTDLEDLLRGSFPNPGDADKVRQMFLDALETDGLGVGARRLDGKIRFTYPIVILCSDGVVPA
jgi:SAM-dependent methyltransferase